MNRDPVEFERDFERLGDLLVDLELDPVELITQLRSARDAVVVEPALRRDLARAELRFLDAQFTRRPATPEFAAALQRARDAARDAELTSLAHAPETSAAALFDCAELRARATVAGDRDSVEQVGRELRRRLEVVSDSEMLHEEARERFAALSTDTDDLDLAERVALLESNEQLLAELSRCTGDGSFAKLAARLGRLRCDLMLQGRLDDLLTRRGAAWLENISLLLLFVVLGLLLLETCVDLSAVAKTRLQIVDASVCVFFIAEFLFKLALAPARGSWFLRNALTDLLPAIPAALYFAIPVSGAEETAALRMLRLLRVTWFARYIQALRPVLRLVRLLLFMARGLDSLVRRFAALLNRNLVFFEEAVMPRGSRDESQDVRLLSFRALRREHVALSDLPGTAAAPLLVRRAADLAHVFAALPPEARSEVAGGATVARDVAIEHAIEDLYELRPEELSTRLPRNDINALDRIVRVLNAPLVRWMPILRWFCVARLGDSPEQRVVQLGRRIAAVFERWRERALYLADLQGIVTGPQILDRLATAMVKASFRPARNLILFGLFFVLVRLLVGEGSTIGQFLQRFVATPVLILGSACAVVLGLGFWLKRLAGEAADQFKLTSEASYIGLLELTKRRSQDADLEFLARRVFRWDMDSWGAAALIADYVKSARTGIEQLGVQAPDGLEDELYRVSLLYLHFLDGAVLHDSDVTTNEQLLANLSLANVRTEFLGFGRKDKKRLRKLSLQQGPLLRGPYVWFRCITESVAVETAKRVTDYNRNCLSLRQREIATPEERRAFAHWLRRRARRRQGRLEQVELPASGTRFATTEFNALDFLSTDAIRERHVERVFGRAVARLVKSDRRAMIREVFGTKPLHMRPRPDRTINFYQFYWRRLSRGRVFLAPLYVAWLAARGIRNAVSKTVEIVQEIVSPERAVARRVSGVAPFAVALRKIHRMKAPTLLEAMRMRVLFDPVYSGAPAGWSGEARLDDVSELERDLDFLDLHERDREEMRDIAARNLRRVEQLHAMIHEHADDFVESDPDLRRRGERAVTIAYMTDREWIRTLLRAESWLEGAILAMEAKDLRLPRCSVRRFFGAMFRGFERHPVDRWLDERIPDRSVSKRGRANFKRAWTLGDQAVRDTVRAWLELDEGRSPSAAGLERARALFRARDEVSRELTALRAIQSLSVLDVRNYRRLVFDLGGYEDDGESRELAEALP